MSSTVLWYSTRATGLVALVLLSLSMVLGMLTATRFATQRWPGFAQQELHRRVSMLSVLFLAAHVVTAVLDTYVHIGLAAVVIPFTSGYDRLWVAVGTVGLDLGAAVLVTSLLRPRVPARLWRAVHWAAYGSWPLAVSHALAIGTDERTGWVLTLTAACIAAVALSVAARLGSVAAGMRRSLSVAPVAQRPLGVERKYLPGPRSPVAGRTRRPDGGRGSMRTVPR